MTIEERLQMYRTLNAALRQSIGLPAHSGHEWIPDAPVNEVARETCLNCGAFRWTRAGQAEQETECTLATVTACPDCAQTGEHFPSCPHVTDYAPEVTK